MGGKFGGKRSVRIAGMAILLLTSLSLGVAAQSSLGDYHAQQPVLITSFGQSQDARLVDLLATRLKLEHEYDMTVDVSTADWSKYQALIFVIGGSGKGLGSAGLDISDEVKRCQDLVASAKGSGCRVIAMHIGGPDRRLSNSEPFLPFCKDADAMIVKADGNQDGYFTDASADSGVPIQIVETTMEIQGVLKDIFNL